MKLLTASTEAEAEALNAKALAYAIAEQGALGTRWSSISTNGVRFAIAYDDSIAPAFTAEELVGLVESVPGEWSPV